MESCLRSLLAQRIMCAYSATATAAHRSTYSSLLPRPPELFHTTVHSAILLFHGANKAAVLSPFPNREQWSAAQISR
jgi:hypothetical protein